MKTSNKLFISFFFSLLILISTKNSCYAISQTDSLREPITLYFTKERDQALNKGSNINLNAIISNETLINDLIFKYKFLNTWYEKVNIEFYEYNYQLEFLDFNLNSSNASVNVKRNLSCTLTSYDTFKSLNEEYIFILKNKNDSWKITDIIFKEENEDIYNRMINAPTFSRLLFTYKPKWESYYENIDNIYFNYNKLKKSIDNKDNLCTRGNYSIEKAINYATSYALDYNSNYKNFDNIGGDCTNYISQCLHAGGLPLTNHWKPYSNSWINVNYLKNYLVNNELAIEYKNIDDSILGYIIQFYNDNLQRYAHSGIITKKLSNDDYGYCAHSYNKLNYPLSLSYPLIYNKIRILKIIY